MPAATRPSAVRGVRFGIVAMLLAMASFTANDACLKLASAHLPMGEIIVVRGFFATVLIGIAAWWSGALRRPAHLRSTPLAVRTVAEIAATVFYLVALFHMPIANVIAIHSAVPLATTAGAMLFLGERVGPRRWTAIGVGLIGILVIVRPGMAGFSAWSLAALASVFVVALRDLITRRLDPAMPSVVVTLVTAAAITTTGAVLLPFEPWAPLDARLLALIGLCAIFLVGGYSFIVLAMRAGEVGAVAPFRYSALIWAVLFQLLLFGQPVDTPTLVGAAILVATGIYALRREATMKGVERAAA